MFTYCYLYLIKTFAFVSLFILFVEQICMHSIGNKSSGCIKLALNFFVGLLKDLATKKMIVKLTFVQHLGKNYKHGIKLPSGKRKSTFFGTMEV